MGFRDRLSHAWNAFVEADVERVVASNNYGPSYSYSNSPNRRRFVGGDRSIVSAIYNRIGIDVAGVDIAHVKTDDKGNYLSSVNSGLQNCLTVEANIDQAARAFKQDVAQTLFEKGVAAIVPVDTTFDPTITGSYDIQTLRVAEILQWYPQHVRVLLYNEKTGRKQELVLGKDYVAVIENPLYSVMNEPNGTLQRLIRKLSLLDSVDEAAGSGNLDLIIQLPYVVKTEARREQAENRRKDIEMQLRGSQYGIAYTDGTERITQLNRPAENNMLAQIQYLQGILYDQLGITQEVFNGTADDKTMLNYYNRTVEPILTAITESMKRTFLTKTARTQGQSIEFYFDPFRLVAISDMAAAADKFIRNEILTANEMRAKIGMRPSLDPNADVLKNPNMPIKPGDTLAPGTPVATAATPPVGTVLPPRAPLAIAPGANGTSEPTGSPSQISASSVAGKSFIGNKHGIT